jgi:electron transfer flavoprotein alpha subunit
MAGVTHRLGGRIDTHVSAIAVDGGAVSISRWFYRQRIEATLTRAQRPWVILVDPGTGAAWEGAAGSAVVEAVAVTVADKAKRTTVTGTVTPQADQQTIRPDAKLLFVAGAGWTKKQKDGQTHVPRRRGG